MAGHTWPQVAVMSDLVLEQINCLDIGRRPALLAVRRSAQALPKNSRFRRFG
jgi:hypothetical protein